MPLPYNGHIRLAPETGRIRVGIAGGFRSESLDRLTENTQQQIDSVARVYPAIVYPCGKA